MSRLRRIAVFVEEVGAGNYRWVLHEQGGDASEWIELSASPMAYDLWLDAFEDGCAELVRMVPDERNGPRDAGEDEDAPPVGPIGGTSRDGAAANAPPNPRTEDPS
ncbi:hypothetical protein [Variovorax sp.]|uniref:hypothetical protein n=1 Tax=Variovorax sp. TaxID=1871043 RepID=UPI0025E1EA1B|nr:hypothetical protein [Variovorax sp.]